MDDLTTRLMVDLDTTQPVAGASRMDNALKNAASGMDASMRKTQQSVDRAAVSMQSMSRGGAVMGRALVAGMNVAASAAAGAERSFVRMGVSILSAGAMGGAPMAALAAVASVIGLIVGNTDEAAERVKKLAHEIDDWRASAVEAGAAAREAFASFGLSDSSKLGMAQETFSKMASDARDLAGFLANQSRSYDELKAKQQSLWSDARAAQESGKPGGVDRAKRLRDEATQLENLIQLTLTLEKARASFWNTGDSIVGGDVRKARDDIVSGSRGAAAGLDASKRAAAEAQLNADLHEQWEIRSGMLAVEVQAAALEAAYQGKQANEIGLLGEIATLSEKIHYLSQLKGETSEKEIAQLRREVEGKRELLAVTTDINRRTAERAFSNELQMMEALYAVDKQRVTVAQKMIELQRQGRSPAEMARWAAASNNAFSLHANEPVADELRTLGLISDERRKQIEIEKMIRDLRRQGVDEGLVQELAAAKARQPILDLIRDEMTTLSGGIADALVDGAETGWRTFADIGRRVLHDMLSTVTHSLVQSLMGMLTGALGGIGGGGGGGGGGFSSVASAVVGVISGAGGGGGAFDANADYFAKQKALGIAEGWWEDGISDKIPGYGPVPSFAGGGWMPHDGLAHLHKGERILSQREIAAMGAGGGGSGVNVGININGGGGLESMTPEQIGALVGQAATSEIRNRGGMRTLLRSTVRSGL